MREILRQQVQNTIPRGKSSRILVPVLALAAISIVLGGVVVFFAEKLPLESLLSRFTALQIKEVTVTSEWPLTPGTIKAWLPPLEKKNILLVSPDSIIRLLEEKPWVESVIVRKQYPDRISLEVSTKRARAVGIVHGQSHWLDGEGRVIEKAVPEMMQALELPVVTRASLGSEWDWSFAMQVLSSVEKTLGAANEISEVHLGSYPLFKVYLVSPRVEVLFSAENWESQVPLLVPLLRNPPTQIGQPKRISLVFPKKAVVSPLLSQ